MIEINSPILMSKTEMNFLHDFIKENTIPNALILELGAWIGGSTIVMAKTGRRLVSLDYWGEDSFKRWADNVKAAGVYEQIVPIRGEDIQIMKAWLPVIGGLFDFVLIDTSHTYPQTMSEFQLVYPLVKSNGWIFFHDVGHPDYPGCKMAWEELKPILRNHTGAETLVGGQK